MLFSVVFLDFLLHLKLNVIVNLLQATFQVETFNNINKFRAT